MKKIAILSVILILVIVAMVCFASVASKQREETNDLSSALSVIAEKKQMAKYGIVGNSVLLSADDFEKNLNLSRIESITVTEIPAITEGSLCLGDTVVNIGQTISRSNLDLLNYRSDSEKTAAGAFKFKVNNSEYEMTCNLYLLKNKNSSPVINMESERSLSVSTHQRTLIHGTVGAYDSDGDDIRIDVIAYPENGTLSLDASSGAYTYMPSGSYFGDDSFTYVAVDSYGNYSPSQKVSLTVEKRSTDVLYSDMENHKAHHAVLTLTEKNIMSGETIGNNHYFMPDKSVSRLDFLVMMMNAMNITPAENISSTGFDDDSEIPQNMKGYVKKARDMGIINGSVDSNGKIYFYPSKPISRAEAAVMMNAVVKGEVPVIKPVFADKDSIPVWASDALYSMNHLGILEASNGNIFASSEISRAESAEALYNLMKILD